MKRIIKIGLWILGGFVALCLLVTGIGIFQAIQNGPPPPRPTNTPPPTKAIVATLVPSPTPSAAEVISRRVCDKRFVSVSITSTVQTTCRAEGIMITLDTVSDLSKISRDVFADQSINEFELTEVAKFKDKYGNVKEGPLFIFKVTRQLWQKVNWANQLDTEFARLVMDGEDGSYAVVHPQIIGQWRDLVGN